MVKYLFLVVSLLHQKCNVGGSKELQFFFNFVKLLSLFYIKASQRCAHFQVLLYLSLQYIPSWSEVFPFKCTQHFKSYI